MAEWSNAAVLKTVERQKRSVGSNPTSSATFLSLFLLSRFWCEYLRVFRGLGGGVWNRDDVLGG